MGSYGMNISGGRDMKEKILKCLREAEDYVSGQELCQMFDVSRTAIWKVMNQLKEEGYVIDAVKNKGYRLVQTPDLVTAEEVESLLETSWAARPVVYEEEQASTNQTAKMLAEQGASHGTLVVAERQVSGRGRRGRPWHSPKGSGIWMSILLRPQIHPMSASMLTLVAAMAVYDAISSRVEGCAIKWPNDIVIDGRKVCGILTEMSTQIDYINHVTIGVGINVNLTEFPEEIRETATSLRLECGHVVKRAPLIAAVMKRFEQNYTVFLEHGDLSGLKERYSELLVNKDREVRILGAKEQYNAYALGINQTGELIVRKEDGTEEAVYAGEVSVRGVYGYV